MGLLLVADAQRVWVKTCVAELATSKHAVDFHLSECSRSRSGGHADRQTDRPRRFRIVISTPMVARREALLHFRPHGFLEPIPLERLRRGAGPSSRRGIRCPSVATRSFNLRVYVTRHSDLLVCPKRYMAPGPVRNTDTDRPRLSDGIFLVVGCACVGNNRSAALCHNDLAAGNRDRRCEHGSGFADQAFGSIRQLAKIPKLLFDAATDRISDQQRRHRPRLLLSSVQSGLAGASFGKTSLAREEPWRADHRDRFGAQFFGTILDQSGIRCS